MMSIMIAVAAGVMTLRKQGAPLPLALVIEGPYAAPAHENG